MCVLCIAMQINVCACHVRANVRHLEQLTESAFYSLSKSHVMWGYDIWCLQKRQREFCVLKKAYGKSNLVKTPRNIHSLSSAFKRMFAFPRAHTHRHMFHISFCTALEHYFRSSLFVLLYFFLRIFQNVFLHSRPWIFGKFAKNFLRVISTINKI